LEGLAELGVLPVDTATATPAGVVAGVADDVLAALPPLTPASDTSRLPYWLRISE
jgi:hypothetical protein